MARAVLFDVGSTLIRPCPSVAEDDGARGGRAGAMRFP